MSRRDGGRACRRLDLLDAGFLGRSVRFGNPLRPVVAEPQRRQQMQIGRVRSPVDRGDAHEDVFGRALGVLDEHVEIAVVVEDAGVEELVLHLVAGAPAVRLHQVAVGIGRLRVLVEVLHVRVRRRAVEVEVVLLDVLAVVALAVGQAEQPLLEDRVLAVPQGQAKQRRCLSSEMPARPSSPQRYARERAWSCVKKFQASPFVAVVLAHRAPLPLAEVRAPLLPGRGPRRALPRADCCSLVAISSFFRRMEERFTRDRCPEDSASVHTLQGKQRGGEALIASLKSGIARGRLKLRLRRGAPHAAQIVEV